MLLLLITAATLALSLSLSSALSCTPPFNTAMEKFCAHFSSAKFSYCAAQRYCRDLAGELLMGKMKK